MHLKLGNFEIEHLFFILNFQNQKFQYSKTIIKQK
jgi:hypothetical protein